VVLAGNRWLFVSTGEEAAVLEVDQQTEEIIERVAALDIGKAELVCCARVPYEGRPGRRCQDVETYSTMTRSLLGMSDHLRCLGVTRVVMEATSDYWKPVFYLLEAAGFEVWLCNARDVKHLPGRPKTDKLDAVWLCKIAERQMIRPSFVPPPQIRRLRDVTRYRVDLIEARTAEKQRVEKLLEDTQIKLSVVASDIFGVSGREMMAALIAGQTNPKVLAQLARGRLRAKIGELEEAFTGFFTDHHGFLLAKMLARVDALSADITELDAAIEEMVAPFAHAVTRLDEIPGIGAIAAAVIVSEVGVDMSRFPTSGHLTSWARFAPGVKESAARSRAGAPPGTATATWPGSSGRQRCRPGAPTPSSVNATGASPDGGARRRPSSPPAAPSWSSSGICSPIRRPGSPISARTSTTNGSIPNDANEPTSINSKHSASKSPSSPPPERKFPGPPTRHSHAAEPAVSFARPQLDFRIRGKAKAPATPKYLAMPSQRPPPTGRSSVPCSQPGDGTNSSRGPVGGARSLTAMGAGTTSPPRRRSPWYRGFRAGAASAAARRPRAAGGGGSYPGDPCAPLLVAPACRTSTGASGWVPWIVIQWLWASAG